MTPAFPNGKLGIDLSPADQRRALARYAHRFTKEHKPAWANEAAGGGNMRWPGWPVYPVQFASDRDWLENTRFPVRENGTLAARGDCYSCPTWPDHPELRQSRS